jgi:2,2-dialkylglycine decarboxylase (pyruvate)
MTAGLIEQEWLDRAKKFCFRARLDRAHYDGPVFARGQGSVVWDVEGKSYLDFNSGQLCAALGHNPPRVVEAIAKACKTMMHASSTYYNVQEVALAEKLAALLPPSLNKVFFGMAGSDSTEAAINIAKKVTGRHEIASPHISFHGLGDTPRALSFANWHRGMNPPGPGNFAIMAPYCFRCPIHQAFPGCQTSCLTGSLQVLDAQTIAPVAAVITEPIFSAGGVIEPPPGWLQSIRDACDDREALLILDEAQTGLAKLGTMWGFEHEGVIPDILTISKHFGGGMPICAVVTTEEIENKAIENGFAYSHSHSSDPLACAAALASIETIEEENLVERATAIGSYWRKHLEAIRSEHDVIADVRGRGLLQGIELQTADGSPAASVGQQVAQKCMEMGLLFSTRRAGSVIRFTPPFTTTQEQMDQAASILDQAFTWTEARS